ncbi:poly-gamma-glutamate synthesis protein (capsule biosynthesis protein) [Saccharopolyspora lacisalsi]|uniref:Poly-gamma-glutamate synthesis protein (Capsule biosynthesis protein) n=1 Tax=Halosaccharopolyspora lacisalsi TaxID=1000566 RepID=A0A839DZW3_9PSEU|nr:CapA family protein [Halosaccharopolyspora lacisalsi]MBA8824955.1 poly-gamma-glutamate synthesis protein (capsule biosynthesis protein) [Halosaccharopolyspora lacisalsi]
MRAERSGNPLDVRPNRPCSAGPVTLFLGGDVMPGRGLDQILPHPGDPRLREPWVGDARYYVRAAEEVSAPIDPPVDFSWPWGEALRIIDGVGPDARVINLESSVTRGDTFAPGKAVHYRMTPENLPCVTAVAPDLCVLANNHVLDFGPPGLEDTLGSLSEAGLLYAGAGRDAGEVTRPAVVPVGSDRRVVVLACGATSSGIPPEWAASGQDAGVSVLPDLSEATADGLTERLRDVRRHGDVVVVSVHWGSNWGYEVPCEQVRFAHRLIEGGVHVVHGHSSHHPRPIEMYRGGLVLYGSGDLLDDYEGIGTDERYRDDLRLLYFPEVLPDGGLSRLRIAVTRVHRMRLCSASAEDARWVCSVLSRTGHRFGTRVDPDGRGMLILGTAVGPAGRSDS